MKHPNHVVQFTYRHSNNLLICRQETKWSRRDSNPRVGANFQGFSRSDRPTSAYAEPDFEPRGSGNPRQAARRDRSDGARGRRAVRPAARERPRGWRAVRARGGARIEKPEHRIESPLASMRQSSLALARRPTLGATTGGSGVRATETARRRVAAGRRRLEDSAAAGCPRSRSGRHSPTAASAQCRCCSARRWRRWFRLGNFPC